MERTKERTMERFEEVSKEVSKEVSNDVTKEVSKEVKPDVNFPVFYIFLFIFLVVWWFAGIIGFIMSLVCCFYNGTTTDKFLGIVMAWIFGPFYWLYFIYNSTYCTRFNPVQQPYYV